MEPLHIHVPYTVLDDHFDLIRQRRYDLEIYFSASALDRITKTDLEHLVERLDWKPALTLHAPFLDLNPGALDPMVKSATQARFRQFLNVAIFLKPRASVFHAAYDKWRYNGHLDNWFRNSVDTWQMVMETASKIGLCVAIENVFDETPDAIQMLMEKIDSPDFGFCFDTGHFNLFTTVSMERWFESLGHRLLETHLHDNNGTEDSHWALGRGTIDFEKFFSLLNAGARFPVLTIEAHDKDDIEASLERVKALVQKHCRLPRV
jgi:sugar phosphate isomerase/epimerase